MGERWEAVVVCLDTSEYMRNEDYMPSRWGAQSNALSYLFNEMDSNSAFALVAMAGKRAEVLTPSTQDRNVLHAALEQKSSSSLGGQCNYSSALQMAHMVLRNKPSKCTVSRVIVFSGSPVCENIGELHRLARLFKKDKISLDIISFGDASGDVLEELVNIADNHGNCHLIVSSPDDHTLAVGLVPSLSHEVTRSLTPPPRSHRHSHSSPSSPPVSPSSSHDSSSLSPPSSSSSSSSLLASSEVPILRMPPPNRMCKRVVVDHTKYASIAHRASLPLSTLSLSLTLSLRNESSNSNSNNNSNNGNNNNNNNNNNGSGGGGRNGGNSRDSRVVLLVPLPQRHKKIIIEFRAGRCQMNGSMVRPMKGKGQLVLLQINNSLLQFIWRDRSSGSVELEALVHPGEARFHRVPSHITPARVYCLHLFDSNTRHFFWMQYNDTEKDEEHSQIINSFLGPRTTSSSSVSSSSFFDDDDEPPRSRRPYYHALDAADLQQLLTLYNLPLPSFVSRSLQSRSHSSHGIGVRNNNNNSTGSGNSGSGNSLRGHTRGASLSNRNLNHLTTEFDGTRRWIKNPVWEPNPNPRIRTLGMDVDSTATLEETTVTETAVGNASVATVLPVNVMHQKGNAPTTTPVPTVVNAIPSPSTTTTPSSSSSTSTTSPSTSSSSAPDEETANEDQKTNSFIRNE